jgi:RNA polymerase sigma-70 factor (ECF subfamily)
VVQFDQILEGCRQYDKFAQKMLYEMYAPKMKGLCFRYVCDSETVKDIVQDGFIKVFSNIKQFDRRGSFEGWLKRIFINTAITHIRKNNKKNKNLSLEDIEDPDFVDTDNSQVEKQFTFTKNNLELLSSELSEEELLIALQRIPEKFRTVFNLYCIEHLKHEEIAKILDIEITTSRTRLLRSRSLIQDELYTICCEKLKHEVNG